MQASIFRQERQDRTPLRQRAEESRSDTRQLGNVVSVTALEQVPGGVGGEEAWNDGMTYDDEFSGAQRTSNVLFEHEGSLYGIHFEAPRGLFDEKELALRRILETWRFT